MNPLFLLNDYIPGTCSTNVGAQYGISLNGKHGLVSMDVVSSRVGQVYAGSRGLEDAAEL